ncbi:hypothetical protein ACLSY2_10100, partial [Avibacterium avium]|uniref:hypothetical protein n=3 Tax=Pasteurellaceae TaxID=712 RepID=UPI003BF898F8
MIYWLENRIIKEYNFKNKVIYVNLLGCMEKKLLVGYPNWARWIALPFACILAYILSIIILRTIVMVWIASTPEIIVTLLPEYIFILLNEISISIGFTAII